MKILGLGSADAPDAVAVSADGSRWALLGVPSGLADAIRAHGCLQASAGTPQPIAAVLLAEPQVGSLIGLRALGAIDVHTTPGVFESLTASPALDEAPCLRGGLRWHLLPLGGDRRSVEFQIVGLDGLRFTAIALDDDCAGRIALQVDDLLDGQQLLHGARQWSELQTAAGLAEPLR